LSRIDCSELDLKISDWAMSISAETGAKDIDSVVKEMQKTVPTMNRAMVVDSIVEATQGRAQQTDELTKDLNTIKREARIDKNTRKRITELEKYLDQGIAPPKSKRRVKTASDALQEVRAIRDDLQRQVAKSDAVQQAKLIEQIRKLEDKIERGDIQPKQKKVETPKSKEVERLEFERDQLRRDIRGRLEDLKPKTVFDKVMAPFDVSRDITLSYDLGAVFRQGGFFLLGRPIKSLPALREMARATASERGLHKVDQAIAAHPRTPLFVKAKGFLAPTDGTHKPSKREEAHRSAWAEKHIPGVRMSNRAYTSFLNKMRIDMFSTLADTLVKNGDPTLAEARVLARLVNIATGRGELGSLSKAAEFLAIPFLAPRYVASRFQLLGGAFTTPFKAAFGPKELRRVQRRVMIEYGRYMIGLALFASILKMIADIFGKELVIETDATSSDFGKGRMGNTRVDLLSGIGQPTVLLTRLIKGELKSTTTGMTVPLRGKGARRDAIPGVIGKFLRYKLSPFLGRPLDVISGTNAVGEPVTPQSVFINFVTPIALREIKESIEEQGVPTGAAVSLAAILGMGVQTYGVALRSTSDKEIVELIRKNVYKRTGTVTRGGRMVNGRRVGGHKVPVRAGQAHIGKEEMIASLRKELLRRQEKKKKKREPTPIKKVKNALDSQGLNVLSKALKE
jgi:hypothetical protein